MAGQFNRVVDAGDEKIRSAKAEIRSGAEILPDNHEWTRMNTNSDFLRASEFGFRISVFSLHFLLFPNIHLLLSAL